MHPIHPIREKGEESDIEEKMPELVDISDNEISSTRKNLQGTTTENSKNAPPNPQVLMKNLQKK